MHLFIYIFYQLNDAVWLRQIEIERETFLPITNFWKWNKSKRYKLRIKERLCRVTVSISSSLSRVYSFFSLLKILSFVFIFGLHTQKATPTRFRYLKQKSMGWLPCSGNSNKKAKAKAKDKMKMNQKPVDRISSVTGMYNKFSSSSVKSLVLVQKQCDVTLSIYALFDSLVCILFITLFDFHIF